MKTTVNPIAIKGPAAHVCLGVTKLFTTWPLRRFNSRTRAPGQRFETSENYLADRVANVLDYRELFSEFATFESKTVLEVGCSTGYLLDAFLNKENFAAIGADISEEALARGQKLYGNRIKFVQTTASSIPLPDNSVDVIYTIDTVEHLSRPEEIFRETYRILKPGGQFLVYFAPWYGPCGSHLDDIIPLPWMHVVFSMDTLLNVAAHIYESEDHKHACYWYDAETGALRPNPYLDRERWREFLNDLSVRKFRRLLKSLPYQTVCFRRVGFGGKAFPMARWISGLAQVRGLDEFFIKAVFCVLRK
jgi:SAM-dependent methyltransferase